MCELFWTRDWLTEIHLPTQSFAVALVGLIGLEVILGLPGSSDLLPLPWPQTCLWSSAGSALSSPPLLNVCHLSHRICDTLSWQPELSNADTKCF